jgi:hypothetical protein
MIKAILLPIAVLLVPMSASAADSCSMQEQHQSKYEKFMINDVPSLLEACGLGLSISLPSFQIPSLGDLFCGYSAGDLNDWYQNSYSSSAPSPSSTLATANKNAIAQSKAMSKPNFNSSSHSPATLTQKTASNADAIRELKVLTAQPTNNDTEKNTEKESNSITKWEPASLFKSN